MSEAPGTEAAVVEAPATPVTPAPGEEPVTPAVETPAASKPEGSGVEAQQDANPFKDLQDEGTREWLSKKGVKSVADLAERTREQERLLGSSIRMPAEDATEEERSAFLEKVGLARPEKAEAYEFQVPEKLPEELPYDAERASRFKEKAHELGMTQAQAAGLHDWFTGETVSEFEGSQGAAADKIEERATAHTASLEKLWGPLDGDTAKANLEFADKALMVGGPELQIELQDLGVLGPNKEVLSLHLATTLASLGAAIYTEDGKINGNPALLDNPFADGEKHNLTNAMKIYKSDPGRALELIAAAGKKPEDFGLKAK